MSTVFRVQKNTNYTVMSNYHLFDEQLSAKATTYLSIMLALPPTWDYTLSGLATFKKDGLSSVRSAINELEEQGYLLRQRVRDKLGQLKGTEYIVYETPEMNPNYKSKKTTGSKKTKKSIKNKKTTANAENTHFEPKCDFPTLEKPTLEKPTLENQMQSNTNQSNTNQSSTNQSVCHRAENEKTQKNEKSEIDRLTDRPPLKTISFSEILDTIGYHDRFMPKSEKDCYEPDSEAVKHCSIPYSFRENKKAMQKALTFLFGFNYYSEGMNEQDKDLFAQVITLLTDLSTADRSKVSKCYVNYHEVIDKLNGFIADNMLYDWFLSFIPEWNTICQEREIKNVRAYLKSCIWSWLNEYEIIENSLSRSISNNLYSSNASEIDENASKIDLNTNYNKTTLPNQKSAHEPDSPFKIDFSKSTENSSRFVEDNVDISDSELDETEIDYELKSGKTEQDMVDIFLNKSMSVTEKAEWLDEFVDNWRNSDCHFIFSNIRYELEELAYRKSSDDNSDISIDETEKRRILRSIGF